MYEGLIIYKLITVYPCTATQLLTYYCKVFLISFYPLIFILDAVLYSSKPLLATENPLMANHKSMTSLNNFSELASSGTSHISSQ